MLDLISFNYLQLDAIQEMGNIGAGNAATSLAKLLSKKISMKVPRADLVSVYSVADYYGDPSSPVAAVFVRSTGAFNCSFIFMQTERDSNVLMDLFLQHQFGRDVPQNLTPEFLDSALSEVSNVVLNSFLNAVSSLIGTTYTISVPEVLRDMLGSIFDVISSIYGQVGDMALIVNAELTVEGVEHPVSGHIIMLPDPDALELLLRKLQVL